MDIKDLNKPQLIFLGLLLSFVTSLATGITTVTLMQQAPPSFTVPVNRVIQQTVEKIQQVEGKTVTQNQTVVVKEEDLVVDAIAKNQAAIFNITKEALDAQNNIIEVSAGRGFAISGDGVVVADASFVPDGTETYYLKNDSGKFRTTFLSGDKLGLSLLKIGTPLDPKNKLVFTPVTFGDLSKMKAGQKIIVLGNSISSFLYDGNKDLKVSGAKSNGGALVLDLNGDTLGIVLSGDVSSFASGDAIKTALASATSPKQ